MSCSPFPLELPNASTVQLASVQMTSTWPVFTTPSRPWFRFSWKTTVFVPQGRLVHSFLMAVQLSMDRCRSILMEDTFQRDMSTV